MASALTADQAAKRIQEHFGTGWKTSGGDGFKAGKPDTVVTGIATTWTPTVDVLKQAVAKGQNLIISVEAPYWVSAPAGGGGGGRGRGGAAPAAGAAAPAGRGAPAGPGSPNGPGAVVEGSDAYKYKSSYVDEHKLVIWRFSENWDALPQQFRLRALAASLGWQSHEDVEATKLVAQVNAAVYALPKTTLSAFANDVKAKQNIRAMRVLGDPNAAISRVVLRPGYLLAPDVMQMVRDTKADAVVVGEACEWEAFVYCEDWINAGWGKAMLMMGYAVSEDPGSKEMASWLKSLIPEVPVSSISSGEPFTPVKA